MLKQGCFVLAALAVGFSFVRPEFAAAYNLKVGGFTWPVADGAANACLATDGAGNLSFLNLRSRFSASSPLVYNSTTGAFSIAASSSSVNGYLSSTDWATFNAKQPAGSYLTAITGDVSAAGPGSIAAVVNTVGGYSASNVASGATAANAATNANTPSTIVKRDASGNFTAGTITGALSGNATTATTATTAGSFTGSLSGDVTGTQSATAISAATVTGKALTGLSTTAGTPTASDTILGAIGKLTGTDALKAPLASPTFTGTVTAPAFSGALTGNVTGNVSGTSLNVTGIVAKANGGTGIDNTSVTFPSSGTIPTLTSTATLTNKTLTSPAINGAATTYGTASSTNFVSLPSDTLANLTSLSRSAGKLYYATDQTKAYIDTGSALSQVGSGSGGSGANNLVADSGFENSSGATNSGGTMSYTTTAANVAFGAAALQWTPAASTAAGQYVGSSAITIPPGVYGRNGAASILYRGDASSTNGTLYLQAVDGSGNVLAQTQLVTQTAFARATVNFIFPSTGTVAWRIKTTATSSASPTALYFDSAFVGPADELNISQVAQAQLLGTISITGCASGWSTTSGTFADFATQTGCSYATTGSALAPTSNIPGIRFASLPPGEYKLEYEGGAVANTSGQTAWFQFYDGTNTARESSSVYNSAGSAVSPGFSQSITYASAQSNVTLSIRGKTASTATGSIYGTSSTPGVIRVFYYPSQSQLAVASNIPTGPTYTFLKTAGSGTYTTPIGVSRLEILMVGAGGGGGSSAGSTTGGNTGFSGTASTFGTSLLSAGGGSGGVATGPNNAMGGSGGTATLNSPAIGIALNGGQGSSGSGYNAVSTSMTLAGGAGASTPFGGAGGAPDGGNGRVAAANTGSGGSGGAISGATGQTPGAGGGAGAYISAAINAPASSYSYTVGAGGTGASPGAGGNWGGSGADGVIIIKEIYARQDVPVLVGSVTSNSSGAERIERVSFSGNSAMSANCSSSPCTIASQSGSWISSVTRGTAGTYTLNMPAGIFSSAPTCTCAGKSVGSWPATCSVSSVTTVSALIETFYATGNTGASDAAVHVICQGPR